MTVPSRAPWAGYAAFALIAAASALCLWSSITAHLDLDRHDMRTIAQFLPERDPGSPEGAPVAVAHTGALGFGASARTDTLFQLVGQMRAPAQNLTNAVHSSARPLLAARERTLTRRFEYRAADGSPAEIELSLKLRAEPNAAAPKGLIETLYFARLHDPALEESGARGAFRLPAISELTRQNEPEVLGRINAPADWVVAAVCKDVFAPRPGEADADVEAARAWEPELRGVFTSYFAMDRPRHVVMQASGNGEAEGVEVGWTAVFLVFRELPSRAPPGVSPRSYMLLPSSLAARTRCPASPTRRRSTSSRW